MRAPSLRIGEFGLIRTAGRLHPHAASSRYGVEDDAHRVVPETSDETVDQLLVHVADEIAILLGQRMEGTVPEAHAPSFVSVRFVAPFLQDVRRHLDRPLRSRARDPPPPPLGLPDLETRIARRTTSRLVGFSLILRTKRAEQYASKQVVAPLRDRDVELAIRRFVVLRGPAGPPATSPGGACVREREEPTIDELVEVERRELPGDPGRGGSLLARDRKCGAADMQVELAPQIVFERAQRLGIPREPAQHGLDVTPTQEGDTEVTRMPKPKRQTRFSATDVDGALKCP